jgi:hypothetical protein
MAVRLRLDSGHEVLEEWAESACQAERNIIYEALFAIADGSAFMIYDIFGNNRVPPHFVIFVKNDLVLRILLRRSESAFDLLYVGVPESGTQDEDVHQESDAQ